MQNNTDHPSIEKYGKEFSRIILDSFFDSREKISGPEILELTPVRQVNLLVIKSLLFQWKKETESLRSPYFDFTNEDVQKALSTFMNTVSRHISIDRKHMEPLLLRATSEAILLIFFPYVFYTELIEKWQEDNISLKDLKQIDKYVKVNNSLMDSLIYAMTENKMSSIDKETALKLFNDILEDTNLTPADTEEFEKQFHQVHTFDLNEFFKDGGEIDGEENDEVEPEQQEVPDHREHIADVYDKDEVIDEDKESDDDRTLNEQHEQKNKSTLADLHEKQRIEKISKYISINQKFMFINVLFDKDWGKFEKALDFLDQTSDKYSIFEYLDNHAPTWRDDVEEAEEFRSVIEKKIGEPIE